MNKWTIAREALLGSQRSIAVTAALPPNIADIGFQPLHPTSLAHMPLPATFTGEETEERRIM